MFYTFYTAENHFLRRMMTEAAVAFFRLLARYGYFEL